MKHTPTPWKVFYAKNNGSLILGIGESNGQGIVASNGTMWDDPEIAKANAEFIVQVVNSHASLLEAAKSLLPYEDDIAHYEDCPYNFHDEGDPEYICDCGMKEIYEKAREAIKKAEGKE